MLQAQKTFIYEITLYEPYKNVSQWSDRERNIQERHLTYLDSLTKKGDLEIAGIVDPSLENQTGLIILSVDTYEQAQQIVVEDPSIKEGMMSARLRPIHIYFRRKE